MSELSNASKAASKLARGTRDTVFSQPHTATTPAEQQLEKERKEHAATRTKLDAHAKAALTHEKTLETYHLLTATLVRPHQHNALETCSTRWSGHPPTRQLCRMQDRSPRPLHLV